MNGILVIDKPAGVTSARVVSRVKRLLPRGTKVGHAGTLDPFATGVLVLLVGRATRQCEAIMGQPKRYEAVVKLGATTETDDPESPEKPLEGTRPIERERIESAVRAFVGPIQQRPPAYSAIKVGGKRASDRVRAGQAIELQPRTVQVYRIDITHYDWPRLGLSIECGRGTYIRSIARDLGEALGVGGYLTELKRTAVGEYVVDGAVSVDELDADNVARFLQ